MFYIHKQGKKHSGSEYSNRIVIIYFKQERDSKLIILYIKDYFKKTTTRYTGLKMRVPVLNDDFSPNIIGTAIFVVLIFLYTGLEYAAQQKQEVADLVLKRSHEEMTQLEASHSAEVTVFFCHTVFFVS